MADEQHWIVGIDTGGTFTDVAAMDVASNRLRIAKVPSTPAEPWRGVLAGLKSLLEADAEDPIDPADIGFFAHGTTVATNALLEGKGATAGLLLTRGFNAIYALRGGLRPSGSDLIDTFYQKPSTLVPLRRTAEVAERVAFDGTEIEPLDEQGVREAARWLRARGITSVAVCYLFSFMNPAHEQRTAEILREEIPDCRVSLSSSVLPVIREYQRLSTTVLDAYVGPVIESYLTRLAREIGGLGLRTRRLFLMQSNGGLMHIDVAATYPNQTLLSGPAAGVVFGAQTGQLTGEPNVVTFDMGGTSTDISVLAGDAYQETRSGQISGQEIGTPMIQIRTLGAGGGTLAWIGPDGLLKAGPRSAGADPGPACYGRGGTEPTISDANLVLGYLDPNGLVGGRVKLDPGLAEEAIRTRIAEPLGLTVPEAALGIVRVVNVNMEVGLRLSLVERGLDQRRFALVAFGGAGPVHAARVAQNVGLPRVVIPPYPGISCAMGLLQTDVKHYFLQSRLAALTAISTEELNEAFRRLEERALDEAKREGFDVALVQLQRQLDLRYPHQGYELTVPCAQASLAEGDKEGIRRAFDRLHQEIYGVSAPEEVPEVVNVRLVSISAVPKLVLPEIAEGPESADAARIGTRRALFEEAGGYVETPIYERAALRAGAVLAGPAIVEQMDSTTVIVPGQRASVDRLGMLVIETGAGGA